MTNETSQLLVGWNGAGLTTTGAISAITTVTPQLGLGWKPGDGYELLSNGNIQGPRGGLYVQTLTPDGKMIYKNNNSYFDFVGGEKVSVSSPFPSGGRLGSDATQREISDIALLAKEDGWEMIAGGKMGEEFFPLVNPISGRIGNYGDLTLSNGKITLTINTVTVNSKGIPTPYELEAARLINESLRVQGRPPIELIQKGQGTKEIIEILKKYK